MQAVLAGVMATVFLATGNAYQWVALAAATLYAGTAFWHQRAGEAAAAVAVLGTAVLIGFATREPFLSEQVGLGIFIPAILATVLLSPRLILITMGVQWAVLVARAGGGGVLTHPMNLILGAMIAGGLAFARSLTDAALRSAMEQARRAEASLAEIDQHRHDNEVLQQQLAQTQRLESLWRLAGGVAHDFNNLLTGILSYTALAQGSLDKPAEALECLSEVTRAGNRAALLTKQLLAFARRQRLETRIVDVARLVEDASRMLGQLVGERIRMVRTIASDLPVVRADPGQLEQVLTNLVLNARDAMDGAGSILVDLTAVTIQAQSPESERGVRPDNYLRLTVADSGVGMAPELAAKIFEPFFTTKGPHQGTGLGLSTCLGIVLQHDGFMLVDSVPLKGTTMTVLLPAAERQPLIAAAPEVGSKQHKRSRILIVEDDPMVRQVTFRILTHAGFEVETATNADVGLARLMDPTLPAPDLLLSDLMMPGMGGEALADKARVLFPRLPVIFLSGFSSALGALTGGESMTRLIEKPFLPGLLISSIHQMIESATKTGSEEARGRA